jgi:hypothetical protein
VRDRILAYLREHPEGVDDDALTTALGLNRRQHVNQECRRLVAEGLVKRERRFQEKTRNFFAPDDGVSESVDTKPRATEPRAEEPWYWEGNVQDAVARYLLKKGYGITNVADTENKAPGVDIAALSASGQRLHVSVKGRPRGTAKTSAHTQARHYFASALLDIVAWHGQSDRPGVALGLPDFVTYMNLLERVTWLLTTMKASVIWVYAGGRVEAFPDYL